MSMSLDGFIADENDGVKEVFAWHSRESKSNAQTIEESTSGVGAVLTGRHFPALENAPVHLEGPEIREGDGVTQLHHRVVR